MKTPRLIAIGDVHGNASTLKALFDKLDLAKADTVVMLGDYIDRGKESYQVIELILETKDKCNLITLRGNHEQMLLDAMSHEDTDSYDYRIDMGNFIRNGGSVTLDSYLQAGFNKIPAEHISFFNSLPLYYENENFIFCHAMPSKKLAMNEQKPQALLWQRPSIKDYNTPYQHISGKKIITGHTPHERPIVNGDLFMIDTVMETGRITAIDTTNLRFIDA